jgi:GNAT superfamily N-acetyltransferase
MFEHWFRAMKLPLSWRQFHQLPQNPAYKYEYLNETAWLSPRPKYYAARLPLHPRHEHAPLELDAEDPVGFRRLDPRDWGRFSRLFAGAFRQVQPFASLSDRQRLKAARECLKSTRAGVDGPLIEPACHVAVRKEDGSPQGVILVTLVPIVDLDDCWSLRWRTPPPPDSIEKRLGRPHLTWIFVGPRHAGYGVGTALLAHAVRGLRALGYTELVSSFLLGNASSELWHWRCGFELLPYVGSRRQFRARMRGTLPRGTAKERAKKEPVS